MHRAHGIIPGSVAYQLLESGFRVSGFGRAGITGFAGQERYQYPVLSQARYMRALGYSTAQVPSGCSSKHNTEDAQAAPGFGGLEEKLQQSSATLITLITTPLLDHVEKELARLCTAVSSAWALSGLEVSRPRPGRKTWGLA